MQHKFPLLSSASMSQSASKHQYCHKQLKTSGSFNINFSFRFVLLSLRLISEGEMRLPTGVFDPLLLLLFSFKVDLTSANFEGSALKFKRDRTRRRLNRVCSSSAVSGRAVLSLLWRCWFIPGVIKRHQKKGETLEKLQIETRRERDSRAKKNTSSATFQRSLELYIFT